MEFKSIDSLNITECCELLNLDRIDLPTAVQNLATPSEIEQRLILLIDADRSAFQRCVTINDFDNYLRTWPDGFWRDEANKTKMQLLHIKDDDDFFKLHGSTKSGCKKYLSKFPNGKHKMEAEELIKTIKKQTRWFLFILFALLALLLYLSYSPARYYLSNSDRRFHLITSCYADSRQTKNVSKLGGSISIVTLSSKNEKWDYTSTNAWAKAIKYDGKIELIIDKNEVGKRSAIVKIKIYDTLLWGAIATSNYETITVEIVQESGLATYFNIDKDELSLPKEGHADGRCRVVNVNTDGTFWEVVSAPSWCRKVYADIEDKRLEVSVNENTGKTKTGRIVLKSNSGITREIDVVQKGYATYLDVSTSNISISHSGGNRTLAVSTDGVWELIKGYVPWMEISKSGNDIMLSIESNDGVDARSCSITIKSGDIEKQINIKQSVDETPRAKINSVWVEHNIPRTRWVSQFNPYFGWQNVPENYYVMIIHIDYNVYHMKGKTIKVCAFFFEEDGDEITTSNTQYRAPDGQVTVQETGSVTYKNSHWGDFDLEIPYYVMPKGDYKFYIQIHDSSGNNLTTSDYEYFQVN